MIIEFLLTTGLLLASSFTAFFWMGTKLTQFLHTENPEASVRRFTHRVAYPLFLANLALGFSLSTYVDQLRQISTVSLVLLAAITFFALTQFLFATLFISRRFARKESKSYQQLFARFEKKNFPLD